MEHSDYPMRTPEPKMFSARTFLVLRILCLIACTFGQSRAEKVRSRGSEPQIRTLPKLQVSDNGRYFVREDGSAFIWIGDTSWHVHAMTTEEMDEYISIRKAQGFTVIQCAVGFPADRKDRVNTYGHHAFGGPKHRDIGRPNESYWKTIDLWFRKLEDAGLYAAVVSFWGDRTNLGRYSKDEIYSYFKWLGHRYRSQNNIVWLTLGEGTDWRCDRNKVLAALRGLRDGDTGSKLVSIHSIWGNSTTTRGYHCHVDFNNWQTSQWGWPTELPVKDPAYRRKRDPTMAGYWRVWEAIEADYQREPVKPVIDAEAWYEGSGPVGDPKAIFRNGGARAYHVRRRAYFTVFAGAAGHTYGAQGVWDKKTDSTKTWRSALELPGARQVGHLGQLLGSRPVLTRIPDQSLIVRGQSDDYDSHVQATRGSDGSYAFIYIADGHEISVDLTNLSNRKIKATWFSPRYGRYTDLGEFRNVSSQTFDPPGIARVGNDWVLVLDVISQTGTDVGADAQNKKKARIIETTDSFSFARVKPEHVGMDQAKLEAAKQYALTGGGSGCIIRGGRLAMAWGDQKQKYDIYSSTKSISVTALGLAISDGKVKLRDKAKKYLPTVGIPPESNTETDWLDELTLWHLSTQTGGFEKTKGWCRQVNRPGTSWMYSDGGPNWLADCLTVANGRDLLDVMNERVFKPLGITVGETPRGGEHDLHWGFNNLDRPHQLNGINRRPFGAGIHCNVQAMAKIGYLYLKGGRWRGRQIIPESFVCLAKNQAEGIDKLPVEDGLLWSGGASGHYGLLWWNNSDGAMDGVPHDAFWSWGLKESFIIVIPSLDLVIARAGDYWAPRNDTTRQDSYNNILKPFLLPICESVVYTGPYPQSVYIPRVSFTDLILDKEVTGDDYASGDQWSGTWADDGHLYMGWGDGTGFGHRGNWRDPTTAFMGLARLEGIPPNHRGVNVWGGYSPESQAGALYVNRTKQTINLKPADGLISIDDTLYWYAESKSDGRTDCQLLTSTDYGRTWKDHGRFFEENGKFAFTGIIQFGRNYSDTPCYLGDYLYMYDGGTKAEGNPYYSRTSMLLARIPIDDLLNRRAVEFSGGTPGNPSWTSDIGQAKVVFEDACGVNAHVSCTYNKALDRYFLLTMHSNEGFKKGFGIFESDRPWGPWSTVYYTSNLDSFVPGLTKLINLSLPPKWISSDGKSMWMVFSGRPSDPFYSFNLIKLKLQLISP